MATTTGVASQNRKASPSFGAGSAMFRATARVANTSTLQVGYVTNLSFPTTSAKAPIYSNHVAIEVYRNEAYPFFFKIDFLPKQSAQLISRPKACKIAITKYGEQLAIMLSGAIQNAPDLLNCVDCDALFPDRARLHSFDGIHRDQIRN
ncbi:MAG: hypothetical protein ACI8UO_005967 [Verrucomicrobiales bacterium]